MANPIRRKPEATQPPVALEIHAMPGHLIRRMHQSATVIFDTTMAEAGLDLTPVQFSALHAAASHPGLDQASLAAAIASDRATLGGAVDRLEAKGLVRREVDRHDRRARRVYIEAEGEKVLAEAMPALRAAQAQILQGLTNAEAAILTELLAKALASVGDLTRASLRGV